MSQVLSSLLKTDLCDQRKNPSPHPSHIPCVFLPTPSIFPSVSRLLIHAVPRVTWQPLFLFCQEMALGFAVVFSYAEASPRCLGICPGLNIETGTCECPLTNTELLFLSFRSKHDTEACSVMNNSLCGSWIIFLDVLFSLSGSRILQLFFVLFISLNEYLNAFLPVSPKN